MKMKYKIAITILAIYSIILASGILASGPGSAAANNTQDITVTPNFDEKTAASLSKSAIVGQINRLAAQVASVEENWGVAGKGGFIVYSPHVTARLYSLYQALYVRLHYLNYGDCNVDRGQWDGYTFGKTDNQPYSTGQALQVMAELEQNGVPGNFTGQFHIFLLPYSVPEISGLGGAGFTLISAPVNSDELREQARTVSGNLWQVRAYDKLAETQLAVTLDHEIGHHIHMSFMPKGSVNGERLWNEYLKIRGGSWHGPGNVNTQDWSSSSEETFAEDFRMLYGKDQPYFGDIALGDPRANPVQARNIKRFIDTLAEQKTETVYSSPWIPSGVSLTFWKLQSPLTAVMWGGLGILGYAANRVRIPTNRYSKLEGGVF